MKNRIKGRRIRKTRKALGFRTREPVKDLIGAYMKKHIQTLRQEMDRRIMSELMKPYKPLYYSGIATHDTPSKGEVTSRFGEYRFVPICGRKLLQKVEVTL